MLPRTRKEITSLTCKPAQGKPQVWLTVSFPTYLSENGLYLWSEDCSCLLHVDIRGRGQRLIRRWLVVWRDSQILMLVVVKPASCVRIWVKINVQALVAYICFWLSHYHPLVSYIILTIDYLSYYVLTNYLYSYSDTYTGLLCAWYKRVVLEGYLNTWYSVSTQNCLSLCVTFKWLTFIYPLFMELCTEWMCSCAACTVLLWCS